MKLYGTTTSPYVRRVRMIGHELGLRMTLVDTSTDAGQAELRSLTPIWKVPILVVAKEQTLFDSVSIVDWLIEKNGYGPLRKAVDSERWREQNFRNVINAAMDSGINNFYLRQDGVLPSEHSYTEKQRARLASAMSWVADRLSVGAWTPDSGFGLVELDLLTALEWMEYRKTYAVDAHKSLTSFLDTYRSRPSALATRPAPLS